MNVKKARDPKFGNLGIVEFSNLPFVCQRVYWITDFVENSVRGNHAHKTLEQGFVVLKGEVNLCIFRGQSKTDITLTEDDDIFLLSPGTWRTFYSNVPGTILLVLCNQEYREEDYIRDFQSYLTWYSVKNES